MLRILLSGEECDAIASMKHKAKDYGFTINITPYNYNNNIFKTMKLDAIVITWRAHCCETCKLIKTLRTYNINLPLIVLVLTEQIQFTTKKN